MTTPRVSLVAWEDRLGNFIFVAVPNQRGRYVRTDKSVALVECPQCKAMIGEPCKGRNGDGYGGTTHHVRRMVAHGDYWGQRVDDFPPAVERTPDEWMEAAS
jgi:hypothetical protein